MSEEPKIITRAERAILRGKECSTCGKPAAPTIQLPTRWDMLKNLVQAAKDAIAGGLEVRSAEDTEKVLKICAECPNLTGDETNPRCGVCGCFLGGPGKLGKVSLQDWHCPIGKW